ncbi:hypothetical protein [Lyngbya sp. PCC 8106]|uniref:hypothetical protein n=1 Tax=Lyngbya sp. (strain PCC 8106) TaxID=313612 RepID=UPI0000EA98EC|nr:hypothetical protein [Lyngbya sp. PCC 8106]EAW35162.1 hypothetical protein L8106_13645 [Lyngbya sp. PCC 8106]
MNKTHLPPPPKPTSTPSKTATKSGQIQETPSETSSWVELVGIRNELKKLNHKVGELDNRFPKADKETVKKLWGQFVKSPSFPLFVIVTAILAFGILKPTSYEYQIASPSDSTFEESMNEYGGEGWQTISCRRAIDSITERAGYECILIRKTSWFP